ncbi:hypothetical protein BJY24_003940 [Nocardia transvalensis]|uniref:Uncharacterized protein n=1 Tax=Nocardia transvalensis TaxID=37333 RepID=A0A7W9PG60_9NOCA|nr:hypothetical protein [Nocardia transvalensis]MBB5915073.1 hypothetical protein [Nocardia transvalensis]
MTPGTSEFLDALTDFEGAVAGKDLDAMADAHQRLGNAFADAAPGDIAQAGPRLADVLDEVPIGGRPHIAILIGACVERGADVAGCWQPVLRNLTENLCYAKIFAESWTAASGRELPDPEAEIPDGLLELDPEVVVAWYERENWIRAGLAMLQQPYARAALGAERREFLIEQNDGLGEVADRWDKSLGYLLLVLDDEPLVVLHRDSGTGYRLRMNGIGDNFQLDTLLGDILVGGGHLPGEPPSAEAAACCRDAEGMVPSAGTFLFHAPDGSRVWYEGTPSDIPVLDGARVLVLDERPFPHHFPAGRFFPDLPGDLTLEGVLGEQEAADLLAKVAAPQDA